LTLWIASSALFGVAAAAACSDTASTTQDYIGVTDAEAPRLGSREPDAGFTPPPP
jgi:hypothetical protein